MVITLKLFIPIYEFLAGTVLLWIDYIPYRFNLLNQYQSFILLVGISLIILALTSIYLLSKRRGFGNYFKSLIDTNRLRSFLRQQNSINDFTSKAKVNLDQRIYNSALWHTYIDYAENSMTVWVCIPNNFKAKKVLDSNLDNIAQEVSSYTDKYICSTYTRKGSFYLYKGEKK